MYFYDFIDKSYIDFIDFMLNEPELKSFKDYYDKYLHNNYSNGQLHIRILYCSIKAIGKELEQSSQEKNKSVYFYDYNIVQYFKKLSANIEKSAKYELFDFLGIKASEIGNQNTVRANEFSGNILPVEKSSFKDGYNIISFYIDAEALIRRAYVLRQDCWREDDASSFYQRMVIGKKISSMRKYLVTEKRVFINNIIATLSTDSLELHDNSGNLIDIDDKGFFTGNDPHDTVIPTKILIRDEPNIIGIIDGQHRVYAYHEGTDSYEKEISKLRHKQHLLVTAILFPKTESKESQRRFGAILFKEINQNQTKIKSALTQEIDLMIYPFSTIAICKNIISKLSESGPLKDMIEVHSYDRDKLKTASIVSYGLSPLVRIDNVQKSNSLYKLWPNPDKMKLNNDCQDENLKNLYIEFCTEKIRNILIALKDIIPNNLWHVYNPKTKQGCLSVTFINGFLNVLRCQIKEKETLSTVNEYKTKLKNLDFNSLRKYKSSQYSKMGRDIYDKYIK
jgi:DGQHR domain-containing protein